MILTMKPGFKCFRCKQEINLKLKTVSCGCFRIRRVLLSAKQVSLKPMPDVFGTKAFKGPLYNMKYMEERNNLKEVVQGQYGENSFSNTYLWEPYFNSSSIILQRYPHIYGQGLKVIQKFKECYQFAPLQIKYINQMFGYGVFAKQNMQESTYIGSYVGELRKMYTFNFEEPIVNGKPNDSIVNVTAPYLIAPCRKLNHGRYLNGSLTDFNCRLMPCIAEYRLQFMLVTIREVQKGEELIWNYGKDYWLSQ